MTELLKNAWIGWHDFTDAGKLAALLLISLLFLWIYYKRVSQKTFLIYTTAAAVCCIVPVTAVGLMIYQTRFYDYEWVWSFVPLTAMVAYAVTVFINDFLKNSARNDRRKEIGVILLLLVVLIFCSGMGAEPWDSAKEQTERETAENVLTVVQEHMEGREIYLWAPREIMEYAREYDAGIRLLYGRNMWDASLNAYAYDTYSEKMTDLERWIRGYGEEEPISDRDCAELVADTDVNCILLPENTGEDAVKCFEEALGVEAESLEGYFLLIR